MWKSGNRTCHRAVKEKSHRVILTDAKQRLTKLSVLHDKRLRERPPGDTVLPAEADGFSWRPGPRQGRPLPPSPRCCTALESSRRDAQGTTGATGKEGAGPFLQMGHAWHLKASTHKTIKLVSEFSK